jgi:hypothetical protein
MTPAHIRLNTVAVKTTLRANWPTDVAFGNVTVRANAFETVRSVKASL